MHKRNPPSSGSNPPPIAGPTPSSPGAAPAPSTAAFEFPQDGRWFACTTDALLDSGDLDRLRRFVLEAPDADAVSQRQSELFRKSVVQLSLWSPLPTSSPDQTIGPDQKDVVHASLWGWPLVVSMSKDVAIRSFFEWPGLGAVGLIDKLTMLWAHALAVDPSRVRIHSVIHPQYLASASPLQLRNVLKRILKVVRSAAPVCATDASDRVGNPWSELVGHQTPASRIAGPNQSVALLLTAVVATDYGAALPRITEVAPEVHQALHNLLVGVLTHESTPSGRPSRMAPKTRHAPTIHLGLPDLLPDAATQAQAMDLAWFGFRGRQCDAHVVQELEAAANGGLHWSGRICNEDREVLGEVHYQYDNFWRGDGHIRTIQEHIAFTQATGRMGSLSSSLRGDTQ